MKKISFFPIAVTGVLILGAVLAVMIFGGFLPGYKNKNKRGPAANLVMWGTLPQEKIWPVVSAINKENKDFFNIKYEEKNPATYESETIEALASGRGPDFWIVSQDMVLENKERIYTVPFVNYPERSFLDNFIDGAEIYMDKSGGGITAVPFLVDPMILYWNKEMFSSAGISQPPKNWDEFAQYSGIFTEKNEAGNVEVSGAALGEFTNVRNAKDIMSLLMLQAGEPIVKADSRGNLRAALDGGGKQVSPAEASVRFFNEFSNPSKNSYSWNKALPKSDAMFARGSLAMYFGFAGEAPGLRAKNPHLDFDIAEVPQLKDARSKLDFGRIYGLAILKNSPKKQAAFSAIATMTSGANSKRFSQAAGLASPRRDVLAERSSDAYFSLINKAAVMTRAWIDPDAQATYLVFKDMAESAASGRATVSEAVLTAKRKIDQLLKKP
ncbi:MAG: extracellular solute-binding protein [Candidatus Paceibacter sp.]|nr:extracellular solute-binding protein [Candidatus Paceibacter sp.]